MFETILGAVGLIGIIYLSATELPRIMDIFR